jgi:hypothetical protein
MYLKVRRGIFVSTIRRIHKDIKVITALVIAATYWPTPTARPIAATIQMQAAVVRPWTDKPVLRMTPAPRKPIPVMAPAAILVGSNRTYASAKSLWEE